MTERAAVTLALNHTFSLGKGLLSQVAAAPQYGVQIQSADDLQRGALRGLVSRVPTRLEKLPDFPM